MDGTTTKGMELKKNKLYSIDFFEGLGHRPKASGDQLTRYRVLGWQLEANGEEIW